MNPRHPIDYKHTLQINPEATRQAVLDDLESISGNSIQTAQAFSVNRRFMLVLVDHPLAEFLWRQVRDCIHC